MNREEIKNILPHREPMLLVDEAVLNEDGTATGYYHVKGDEFYLQGHFPGNPIVPGVILCEMMAQSACIMFADKMSDKKTTPVYAGLDKVRFKGMVKPGDTVKINTSLLRARHPMYQLHGEIFVGDKKCLTGDFSFVLLEESESE